MQTTGSIGLLVSCLALLLAGEYYVLVLADWVALLESNHRLSLLLLKITLKAGLPLRVCFLVLYLLWLFTSAALPATKAAKSRSYWGRALQVLLFAAALYGLLTLQKHGAGWIAVAYPASAAVLVISGLLLAQWVSLKPRPRFGVQPEKRKLDNPYSFNFRTQDGWINVPNPFRGIFVAGGAGAGKSVSVALPILHQAVKKGYCGLVYDFKFPTLAEEVNRALVLHGSRDVKHYIVNFTDPTRSHRLNPLKAANLPQVAYAEEYAQAILHNLLPEAIRKKDFWIRSANAILTATIWFLKKHHPAHCSIPHVVNTVLYKDYLHVMSMLATDEECADMVRSALTAIENQAEGQIAGVIGSLQISLVRINSPEVCWVLSGDDFELDLNNPSAPKLLTLGSNPTLTDAFSPVISCIATVALKRMNQPGRRHSLVLLDEAPTLYIPKLEVIPATARSNKVATVYMAQDFSQMVAYYGKETADVIIANLNNQFYGRVGAATSAKYVSELFGREEKETRSQSQSQGRSGHGTSHNLSVSTSSQERFVVRPQDVTSLSVGEFVGTTVESGQPYFWSRIAPLDLPNDDYRIPPFAKGIDSARNFRQIKADVENIICSYERKIEQQPSAKKRL